MKYKEFLASLQEADVVARADYKVGPSGRKSHKEIVFHDGTPNEDDKEKELKKEEVEQIDEKSDQARKNKTMKNMMDASRGARWKVQNKVSADDVRDWDGKHKTAQAQNKAIGRALRNEDLDEAKDTVVKDKDGHVVSWKHEGDWKKNDPKKNPEGKVHNLAGQALKKTKELAKEEVELYEAVESGNKGYGYHGAHPSETADKEYSKAHATVKKVAGQAGHLRDAKKPNEMVKHYLDSRHGRHLADVGTHDHEYIKKDFGKFKKSYNPEHFKEDSDMTITYKEFLAKLNEQLLEYTPGPGGVTRVQGRSYGAQYHDPEGDDDADDKPAKKAEPAVKRGRGRPAGSKSGANQKVTSGKSYGGIATHSLHLPNTNR